MTTVETEQMSEKEASKQFWQLCFSKDPIDTDKSKIGTLA